MVLPHLMKQRAGASQEWSLSRCWDETGASRLPGALFAKANAVAAHSVKEPHAVLLRNCVHLIPAQSVSP